MLQVKRGAGDPRRGGDELTQAVRKLNCTVEKKRLRRASRPNTPECKQAVLPFGTPKIANGRVPCGGTRKPASFAIWLRAQP